MAYFSTVNANRLYLKNTDGTDGSGQYLLERVPGQNLLKLTINKNDNDKFEIWGGACASGDCNGAGKSRHRFDAMGNAWHDGRICSMNNCLFFENNNMCVSGMDGVANKQCIPLATFGKLAAPVQQLGPNGSCTSTGCVAVDSNNLCLSDSNGNNRFCVRQYPSTMPM